MNVSPTSPTVDLLTAVSRPRVSSHIQAAGFRDLSYFSISGFVADSLKDIGILVLGQGSRLPYNRELIESTASMIRNVHPGPVRTAYLNMNEPDIHAGLQAL